MAIKASDLRIGNFLTGEQGLIYSIIEINQLAASAKTSIDNAIMVECPFDVFAPIPLTEEWLWKFRYYVDTAFPGTDVETVPFYTNESSLVLDFHDFAPTWQGITLDLPYKLEFVHQLQNLYQTLNGEELKIKD